VSLELYYHPLSSFCQKVLIGLYENATPFEPRFVDFGDETSAAELRALWPMGRIPVLVDRARDRVVPESAIILEYLARHYPGNTPLYPADPDLARRTRLHERFFDLDVDVPMQKIVGDRLRPAGQRDPFGVAQARAQLEKAYSLIDGELAEREWALGDAFSAADCAAGPALYYANLVAPFGASHSSTAAYFQRLLARPSFARAVREADPYRKNFPEEPG
jgi:glutathione S-transferase